MFMLSEQGPLRVGAPCWILYPGCGKRPVADGIVGREPPSQSTINGNDRSFLMSLCEAGQQNVTVTNVFKKSVELMSTHPNSGIRYLDEVVIAPVAADRTVLWSVRYLVHKVEKM